MGFLESVISDSNAEKNKLVARLNEAERKLKLLEKHSDCASKYPLSKLPVDVLGHILNFVDGNQLAVMMCVDKRLNSILAEDRYWKEHYNQQWGKSGLKEAVDLSNKLNSQVSLERVESKKSWKHYFGERQELENNWTKQKANVTNLEAHSGTVTCLALRGSRMFSGSDDGSMVFWSLDPKSHCGSTENGYDSAAAGQLLPPPALPLAQLVEKLSNNISSGSMQSGHSFHHQLHQRKSAKKKFCEKTRTFHGHGGPVWCLDYDEITNTLYSGSYDQTIKVIA